MTDGQQIGLVLVLAELALMVAILTPVLLKYRAVNREWADLTEQVDAARADFDKAAPIALLAEQMAARADAEARLLAPDLIAEAEAIVREAATQ